MQNTYIKKFNLCEEKESSCDSFISIKKFEELKFPYFISFDFVFQDKSFIKLHNGFYIDGVNKLYDSDTNGLIIE